MFIGVVGGVCVCVVGLLFVVWGGVVCAAACSTRWRQSS